MTLNKALLYLMLAILMLLAIAGVIPVADTTFSTDVDMLHTKHVFECHDRDIFWGYHVVTEPVQTAINLLLPNCIDSYVLYATLMGGSIFFLKLLLASTFRSPAQGLAFLAMTLVFSNMFTETHLFRQFASSYLLLYWLRRRTTERGFMIPLLSFGLHNATTIILLSAIYWRRLLSFAGHHKLALLLIPGTLLSLLAYQLPELFDYFYLRYGFAFTESDAGSTGNLASALLKYFLLAIVAGSASHCVFKKNELLTIGIVGTAILGIGRFSGASDEFVFRLLVPLKFVFLPYFATVLWLDCVNRYIVHGRKVFWLKLEIN